MHYLQDAAALFTLLLIVLNYGVLIDTSKGTKQRPTLLVVTALFMIPVIYLAVSVL